MEYCIIASNYRTEKRQVHVFLDNVVVKFADRGIKCNVIAPQSIVSYLFKKNNRRKFISNRTTENGIPYNVYSPLFLVFPCFKVGNLYIADLSKKSFYHAVKRTYKRYKMEADVIYSHFIQAGIAAVRLAKYLGVPSFIANGEADTCASVANNSPALINKTLDNVSGIISVSSENKEEIRTLCNDSPDVMKKVTVIPNAVDVNRFYHLNKYECRKKLGWDENAFIIAFTGSFIERKGVNRVAAAVEKVGGIHSVFIGVGPDVPQCDNILFCGRVKNEDMVMYLNSADVFVLPTLAEGCCNAIVEAVVCGLPVISSDRMFNYDILDDSCSVLIDPENVDELANAIKRLKEDTEYRNKLAAGSLKKAKELSIDVRVDRILDFINTIMM